MKLENSWYQNTPLSLLLTPLSWTFCTAIRLRRALYRAGLLPVRRFPVPVLVVGNITVGGTGKTPLVVWLAEFFRQQGYWPGIVSRGYKGRAETWPQPVTPDSDPRLVGDEPVVLARRTRCPVVVAPRRPAAIEYLLQTTQCDIVLSDDGLQHYAMHRDLEIAVVDDIRRLGNGLCLPAGPLREPEERLKTVHFVVCKGATMPHEISMQYRLDSPRLIRDEQITRPLADFRGQAVHAVAGIGDPERFFSRLEEQGIKVMRHPFPDHHDFQARDIEFGDRLPVIMTEKDAVKCRDLADQRHWYLGVEAQLPTHFGPRILELLNLRGMENGQKAA